MTESKEFNKLLKTIKFDKKSQEIFCFKYYNKLKMHVFAKYGSFSDWEDIVHDVIKKIFNTDWTNYPYVDKPINWLYAIADNHAKDLLRSTNRICEFNESSYYDFNIDYINLRSDVRNALKQLDVELQYIIYSYYWLGKELYSIADEIGISYTNARVKISRARKLLKKYL